MNTLRQTTAFTLAETLITLGIIGIVSAITIPTLIQRHKLQVLHNQFKQASSIVSQVHQQMLNDGISPYDDFVYNSSKKDETLLINHTETFAKYLNARICDGSYTKCTSGQGYKTLNSASGAHIDADAYTKKTILLNNGMTIWVGDLWWARNRYYVDINGTGKGPNKLGYDLFTFRFDNNKLSPEKNSDTENNCSFVKPAHSPAYLGFGCAYYATIDQNPDDKTKTYWKEFLK